MNPAVPTNLIAVKDDGDHVMGFISWFTVPDRFVPTSKLGRAWASKSLPMHLVPSVRKSVDTFKNACRSVETRRRTGGSRTTEIKVDQVEETYDECVYQVTRMVRDHSQRVIDHPKALRVTFDKHMDIIGFDELTKRGGPDLDAIRTAIQDNFDANSDSVPGSKVRAAIRGLLEHNNGINLRKKAGGVYFVPKEGKDDLVSLTAVLDFLYGNDADLHLIPVANDDYQKQMVQRNFEISIGQQIAEASSLVADKLVSSRKMRSDAVGNLIVQRKQLGETLATYQALVSDDLATTTEQLRLYDEQLKKLMEKVSD